MTPTPHYRLRLLEAQREKLDRDLCTINTQIEILKKKINRGIELDSFVSQKYLDLLKNPPTQYRPKMTGIEMAVFALTQLKQGSTSELTRYLLVFDRTLVPGSAYSKMGMALLKMYRYKLIDMTVKNRVRVYRLNDI